MESHADVFSKVTEYFGNITSLSPTTVKKLYDLIPMCEDPSNNTNRKINDPENGDECYYYALFFTRNVHVSGSAFFDRLAALSVKYGNTDALIVIGDNYQRNHDYGRMAYYYSMAINVGNNIGMYKLAKYYDSIGDPSATLFYNMAIDGKNLDAYIDLALHYKKKGDIQNMKKTLKAGAAAGSTEAKFRLAYFYYHNAEVNNSEVYYNLAIKYYSQAAESGDVDAIYNLGVHYDEQDDFAKAEYYYLRSIELGDGDSMYNLALVYKRKGNLDLMEQYLIMAIEKSNDINAMNSLGLYYKDIDHRHAEYYLYLAYDNDHTYGSLNLGLYYQSKGDYKSMKHYLEKAFNDWGHVDALDILIDYYKENGSKYDKILLLCLKHKYYTPLYSNTGISLVMYDISTSLLEKIKAILNTYDEDDFYNMPRIFHHI